MSNPHNNSPNKKSSNSPDIKITMLEVFFKQITSVLFKPAAENEVPLNEAAKHIHECEELNALWKALRLHAHRNFR